MISDRHKKSLLAISVIVALSGCGGGGGGPGGNPYVRPDDPFIPPTTPNPPPSTPTPPTTPAPPSERPDVPFYTPARIGTYQPLSGDTYRTPIVETYSRDLNGDGRQEMIMQSSSFASSAAQWRNGNLQIFGWNTGSFKNETATWFSGTDNVYMGGSTLKFGDFRGNGRVDMFAATFTDRGDLYGPSMVYFNNGNSTFSRMSLDFGQVDGHDSHVTDLNGDGFSDIIMVDWSGKTKIAFGSAAGTFNIVGGDPNAGRRNPGASSISVADYLGNGSKTMVITDGPSDGLADTQLYSWKVENGFLTMEKIANLPVSRFYLSKWDTQRSAVGGAPHEVRNFTFDFNRDGRPDVIVIAALDSKTQTNAYTEVQFLRNDGSGQFTDVTDSVLVGFNSSKQPSYNPQLIDVNNDGLLDIFLSTNGHGNNSVLVQTKEGKFVESYGTILSDFTQQIKNMTARAWNTTTVTLVRGPDNVLYLASGVIHNQADYNASAQVTVYLSRLGDASSATAPATISALTQVWPWMSAAQANETLIRTATEWIEGMPVIDLRNVFRPAGTLGISLDGREGNRTPIWGGIFVPGLDRNVLGQVAALDDLRRDWTIDMSRLAGRPAAMPIMWSQIERPGESWASRFVGTNHFYKDGFHAAGDGMNWTTGMTSRPLGWNRPWVMGISATQMQGSPWFGFTGVFGNVTSSAILDTTVLRHWSNGAWAQVGVMQTATSYTPGLVTRVDPIWSGYAMAGMLDKNWTLHAGLQPTIFAGSMDLRLPSHVDNQGVMHYTNNKVQIRSDPVYFIGGGPRWQARQHHFSIDAVANTANQYRVMARYRMDLF